jgi:hypothetical protein
MVGCITSSDPVASYEADSIEALAGARLVLVR